ncbi:hypothetical protein [Hymenobacter negativus]|uniref:hypothetical protein n=1 Tax=Hymenobacter negativus TaxID=2795026 RepID=UPI001AAFB28E|nr:hypothetical protein [Hymenobacter negativus]
MATPPSTAQTVVQFDAGLAIGAVVVVAAESPAAAGVDEPAAGCAHAAGLPLNSPNSRRSSNGRPPQRERPADWSTGAVAPLIERLRVMKHLG